MAIQGTHTPATQQRLVRGIAVNAPRSSVDELFVKIPSFGNAVSSAFGWEANVLPKVGDECLVAVDEVGDAWVVVWGRTTKGNNVKEYGAVGLGTTDDYPAFQACIEANEGGRVWVPTGTYRLSQEPRMKSNTTIEGETMYGTVLLALGDFYCIGIGHPGEIGTGAVSISTLKLEALSKQAKGGGVGFNTAAAEIHIDKVCIGNCIFAGLDISGHEIGAVYIDHIRWNGVITAVRENTVGIRVGDSIEGHLVVGIYGKDITGAANTTGDMLRWLEFNYCDTIQFDDVLMQTCTVGVTTQTPGGAFHAVTGLKLRDCVVDTASSHGYILKQVRDCELINCNAQGCFFGFLFTQEALGVRVRGGCAQINLFHGVVLGEGCSHIDIDDMNIADNGTSENAGCAGVSVQPGVSHWSVNCRIGNYYGLGTHTRFGLVVESGAGDHYDYSHCKFIGCMTKAVEDGGTGLDKITEPISVS